MHFLKKMVEPQERNRKSIPNSPRLLRLHLPRGSPSLPPPPAVTVSGNFAERRCCSLQLPGGANPQSPTPTPNPACSLGCTERSQSRHACSCHSLASVFLAGTLGRPQPGGPWVLLRQAGRVLITTQQQYQRRKWVRWPGVPEPWSPRGATEAGDSGQGWGCGVGVGVPEAGTRFCCRIRLLQPQLSLTSASHWEEFSWQQ